MPLSDNPFYGLPSNTLAAMLADWLQCLTDIARAGQSYSINSRTYTAADTKEVKETIRQIQNAIDYQGGKLVTRAYPVFRPC